MYPKRVKEHSKEARSWVITSNNVPQNWILRQLTERDYGIDAYIELILNKEGFVTGDGCFIQLKSTDIIKWKNEEAKLSGIKKSTINYWMNLPAPVFIFWVDLITEEVFYCSIKKYMRENYIKYLESEKTLSITFKKSNDLENKKLNIGNFLLTYLADKHHNDVHNSLRTLIVHFKQYLEFILMNQGRDYFMTVEEDRIFNLVELYTQLLKLSSYSFIEWNCMDLRTMFEEDFTVFKEHGELHEHMLSRMLSQLQNQLFEILKYYKEMITVREGSYWVKKDKILYMKLDNLNIEKLEKDPYSFIDELDDLSF